MAKLLWKLIDGPVEIHIYNGGFRKKPPGKVRTGGSRQKSVKTFIMVRIDPSVNKYDERGRRRPETLPEGRRRKMEKAA